MILDHFDLIFNCLFFFLTLQSMGYYLNILKRIYLLVGSSFIFQFRT